MLLQVFVGIALVTSSVQAQLRDIEIRVARTKLDEAKERGGNKTITTKEVAYKVTVQSKTFKAISQIDVKYMIFYTAPQAGSTEKPSVLSHQGTETLTNIGGNSSVTFETKPFKLVTEDLDAGWYYTTGGANRAKDAVAGVWIRAYADGKLIGEYANPSTTSKKYDWKE
jgi:Zn-dependent alcohol dehydrogenase